MSSISIFRKTVSKDLVRKRDVDHLFVKMAGIYIHIPYCRRACRYCNFHFSTYLSTKGDLIQALQKELQLCRHTLGNDKFYTLYIGGGTPSLVGEEFLYRLFQSLHTYYSLDRLKEVTLEVNPEDVTERSLVAWKKLGVTRLSIGVQSFYSSRLYFLGRAHSQFQALKSIEWAQKTGFTQISVDLIWGVSEETTQISIDDFRCAAESGVEHISAYCLTIEPKTELYHLVKKGEYTVLEDDASAKEWEAIVACAKTYGFKQYEVSSFAKPYARALHNQNYWRERKYLGIGPGAHSFDGHRRWANVSNNSLYIKQLRKETLPIAYEEVLTQKMRWKEVVLLSMRRSAGLSFTKIQHLLHEKARTIFYERAHQLEAKGLVRRTRNALRPTAQGLRIADAVSMYLLS